MAERKNGSSPEIVVVTGASAGIGRATVREFARRGAHLGLIARGSDGLEAARKEVEDLGGRAITIVCDVSDCEAVEQAAARVEDELGPIDVWVNNAFVGIFAEFMDMKPEEFERITSVTYHGQVWGTMAALKRMIPRDRGSIVLVGSALAYRGIPLQSAYCGAKHAIQGFHDSLRTELIHRKSSVRVSMVQLPGVNTPQFDWARVKIDRNPKPASTVYQPEVAARAIYYAAHSRRKEILVGGPTLQSIWADKIASPLLDRYLARVGYSGQKSAEPLPPGRQDNMFAPVPGDHGAHGRFDDKARSRSAELWMSMHRKEIGLGALGLAAMGAGMLLKRAVSAR